LTPEHLPPSPAGRRANFWERLTGPALSIQQPEQHRQAHLVAALLVLLIALGLLIIGIDWLFTTADNHSTNTAKTLVAVIALALLGVAYGLSRSVYYWLGSLLTVIICSSAVFAAYLFDATPPELYLLLYLAIPIFFSTLFLSIKITNLIVALNLGGLLLLPLLTTTTSYRDILIGPFSILLIISALIQLSNYHRNLLEKDRKLLLAEKEIALKQSNEAALQSSMATNRALLNAMPDLMFRISRGGIFVNYKEGREVGLLLPPSAFLGKHLAEIFPADIAQPALYCIEQALGTGEVQQFEYQINSNGNITYYESRMVASAKDEVISIVRDITQRKRAEQEVYSALAKEKELSELKARFVTTTSHEFRTPLSTILSSTELLEHYSQQWPEEKKVQHFRRIQTAVQRMTELLNDILTFERGEAAKQEFRPAMLDLESFCRELVGEMQIGLGQRHNLSFTSHNQPFECYLDSNLLQQILGNLLSNALKYSPLDSNIELTLTYQPDKLTFCLRDHGIGIPLTDQPQLFSAFHRGGNVGTISGTGLGLAIVKKAVELHRGEISFESVQGSGTTFTIILPVTLPD
jgi:PAS domain S-box-containing protein